MTRLVKKNGKFLLELIFHFFVKNKVKRLINYGVLITLKMLMIFIEHVIFTRVSWQFLAVHSDSDFVTKNGGVNLSF